MTRCPWCLEDAGWCDATGGPVPCDGHQERLAALANLASAATLSVDKRRGGWVTPPRSAREPVAAGPPQTGTAGRLPVRRVSGPVGPAGGP